MKQFFFKKPLVGLATALTLALAPALPAHAADSKIAVVAAENFYGDVVQQIGGDRVAVTSILNNPDQDPHLFETTPAVARQIAAAQVVVLNGADYDPWMDKLLRVTPEPGRAMIVAADLMHKKPGANPHLWYDPATMPAVANAIAAALSAADPAHQDEYAARLKIFLASLAPLNEKIEAIGKKYAGAPVAATEPVFAYMAAALRLKMHDEQFQLAVMNDTEPSARDLAAFENELNNHKVRVLFYNKQASDNLVAHLLDLARAAKIPVVGVTETAPPGLSYQAWVLDELNATEKALAGPSSRARS
jgi:zinc/manganese transport system substrate-binding protein